ncbi:hypothetical protein PpBr36_05420 [Pyricularia pennisetigena]|uniref:hypothetical protein n=1 Tax=Pyricularia pennisetigena TaxID=1578925 RepID=UPI00114FD97D|nr:hypothetical protein PpBr36_05420 [Pyricularia pennisetigena]TLS27544.1 hypothetical protein PpBr36_05420 [Pyricularia pennisetigena]
MSSTSPATATSQPKDGDKADEYVNPLDQSPRWALATRAYAIRSGASLGFGISHAWAPPELAPVKVIWLDALLGDWKAKQAIRVDIWEPPSMSPSTVNPEFSSTSQPPASDSLALAAAPNVVAKTPTDEVEDNASIKSGCSNASSRSSTGSNKSKLSGPRRPRFQKIASSLSSRSSKSLASIRSRLSRSNTASGLSLDSITRRPAVINFHGGGFVVGEGTDDSRWCAAVAKSLNAVVFSVSYRLAPGYPFPNPVEDCASAIVQICSQDMASQYAIDTSRVILSGFSAGGNLALASWAALQDPARWGYDSVLPTPPLEMAGMALFYPLLDWTITRDIKRQSCDRPDLTLPKGLTDLFDASYIYPPIQSNKRDDPRLSPGLMPDGMLQQLPPVHLCLCEYDMLLAEGLTFTERLRSHGRTVETRVVKGERHGWDKPPLWAPKENAAVEYEAAIRSLKTWLG